MHKVRLFRRAVLRDGNRSPAGRHRAALRQLVQRRSRHILKLGGDGGRHRSQSGQAFRVGVRSLHMVVADAAGRAGGVRVQHGGEKAHLLRSMRKHAA